MYLNNSSFDSATSGRCYPGVKDLLSNKITVEKIEKKIHEIADIMGVPVKSRRKFFIGQSIILLKGTNNWVIAIMILL